MPRPPWEVADFIREAPQSGREESHRRWSCWQCGSVKSLERDPWDDSRAYCADCWAAWNNDGFGESHVHESGSQDVSTSSQGGGILQAPSLKSGCSQCGDAGHLERDPNDWGKQYCSACWAAWSKEGKVSSSGRSRCALEKGIECEVQLSEIRFSQSTISSTFRDGQSLDLLIDTLRSDSQHARCIPRIHVVRHEGQLVSMDNRRLYCFQMAFTDCKYIPVVLFEDKSTYGEAEFAKKFSTFCGGHQVQVTGQHDCEECLEIIDGAEWFVHPRLGSISRATGANIQIHCGRLMVKGAQRQVEEAVRAYNRSILQRYQTFDVILVDRCVKSLVIGKRGANLNEWMKRSVKVICWESGDGSPMASVSGLLGEVEGVKREIANLVEQHAKSEETVDLLPHSGRFFKKALHGKHACRVEEDRNICLIFGTASDRLDMKQQVKQLESSFSCRELDVSEDRLRSMLIGRKGATVNELKSGTSVCISVGSRQETTVRISGFSEEVERVFPRVRAFLREHARLSKTVYLLPYSQWFIVQAVKEIQRLSGAWVRVEEAVATVEGNQRQVDFADELLTKKLYNEFDVQTFQVETHLSGEIIGKDGQQVKKFKAGRCVQIDIVKLDAVIGQPICRVSGQRADVQAVAQSITSHMQNLAVMHLCVIPSQVGLLIGKAGETIRSLKRGLQIRENTRSSPWIITGAVVDVSTFTERVCAQFPGSLSQRPERLASFRVLCPGCKKPYQNWPKMLQHIADIHRTCKAHLCVGNCGAVFSDATVCQRHEALCDSVHRCPGCRRSFASWEDVQSHVHQDSCKARACQACHAVFADEQALTLHCSSCEKYLEQKLNIEARQKIQEIRASLCDACLSGERRGSDCTSCRAALRRAQLTWHPDKNPSSEALALIVFRNVQAIWEGCGQENQEDAAAQEAERRRQTAEHERRRRQAEEEAAHRRAAQEQEKRMRQEQERRRQANEEAAYRRAAQESRRQANEEAAYQRAAQEQENRRHQEQERRRRQAQEEAAWHEGIRRKREQERRRDMCDVQ